MAYNYLRYTIVCPHLQLFNHKIKGTLSFKQQRWCLCQRQVMPERPSPDMITTKDVCICISFVYYVL